MSTARWLMNAAGGGASSLANSVDLDGVNDYLSRASDFSGNTDSPTMTHSSWVYYDGTSTLYTYSFGNSPGASFISVTSNGRLNFRAQSDAGANEVGFYSANDAVPDRTWTHILFSLDTANSSNRWVRINDVLVTVTWQFYSAVDMRLAVATHNVGTDRTAATFAKGRVFASYVDATYRADTTGTRELFNQISDTQGLIPADSLPTGGIFDAFTDPDDLTLNGQGTGAWTVNGTMARSSRGPNQYNTVASAFDGSADYLSLSGPGGSDSKVATIAFDFMSDDTGSENTNYMVATTSGGSVTVTFADSPGELRVQIKSSGGPSALDVKVTGLAIGAHYSIQISVNMADSGQRSFMVNGVDGAPTWTTYSDLLLKFDPTQMFVGTNVPVFGYFGGTIGEYYLATSYIDLATDNPFWDSDTSKPKYLGESGELPTGSSPLIYLPIRGDDAGNNLGTGGDFTVNSGPFTGARGASEVWKPTGNFNGSTQYETRGTLDGISDGKQGTIVMAFRKDTSTTSNTFGIRASSGAANIFRVNHNSGGNFNIAAVNAAGTTILNLNSVETVTAGDWGIYMVSVDLSTTTAHVVINNVLDSGTPSTITDDTIPFASKGDTVRIGVDHSGTGGFHDGDIGFLWFDTVFIDFSDDDEVLKFIDALVFPREIGDDGSIPTESQPIIYMSEDFELGTNFGTGGDFTPAASPTQGADIGS